MATVTASAAQANAPAIYAVNRDVTRIVVASIGAVLGAAPSAGDVIQMVKVPLGAIVSQVQIAIDGPFTGVATCNIGDGNDVSRYGASVVLSGSTVALAAMPARGLGYAYTANDTIDIQVAAISAVSAVGAFTLAVTYSNQK